MPIISYQATNLPPAFQKFQGTRNLKVTWPQLVWAAITMGKASGQEYIYGMYSALEALHRPL
jgi:hypothetical protein